VELGDGSLRIRMNRRQSLRLWRCHPPSHDLVDLRWPTLLACDPTCVPSHRQAVSDAAIPL